MTAQEKLKLNIETLLESIRLDWREVSEGKTTRSDAVKHINWCISELQQLIAQSEGSNA